MRRLAINGHRLEMYDSIDELPVTRFQAFNRFLLIDAGVGSDLNDFDQHLVALLKFIDKGDAEKAKREVMNLRQNIAFVYEQTTPKLNAFVPLLKSIDGRPVDDLSDEGVREVLDLLSKAETPAGKVAEWVEEVKKKLKSSWIFSFPTRAKARG